MGNPAAFDETREGVRAIDISHGFVAIEGAHLWASIRAFMKTNADVHFHGIRNASAALARQCQNIIAVIEHAVTMRCHPSSWDIAMQRVPTRSYSIGEPVVFYEDMTLTTFGPDVVEREPELIIQCVNMDARFLCHRMDVFTVCSTHMICLQRSENTVVVQLTTMEQKEHIYSGLD